MQAEFFKEFVRVQWDKTLLCLLYVFLVRHHAPDVVSGSVLGALLILIQGQRFKFPGSKAGETPAPPTIGGPPIDRKW